MSMWTHIVAAIDIDTYTCSTWLKEKVEEFLMNAPKITGSEGNAAVFVNVLHGYNRYVGCDCNACEYGSTVVHAPEGGFMCDSPEDYRCPDGRYQSRAVITVIGDLRDRMLEETQKEWDAFKAYVDDELNENGYMIRNCSCNIEWN